MGVMTFPWTSVIGTGGLGSGKSSCVIDSAEVQNGGLHIMNMNRILSNIPSEIVGRTVNEPGFTPPPASHHE